MLKARGILLSMRPKRPCLTQERCGRGRHLKIKIFIIVAGLVAIGFSGLRVYGAYRTEKTRAITRAEHALYEASVKEKEAARIQTAFKTRSNQQRVVRTPSGKLIFAFPADEAIALVNEQMNL